MPLSPAIFPSPAFVGARVKRTTDQSINTATPTAVSFDTVTFDTSGFWSAGSPTLLTVPAGLGGTYLLGCAGEFAATASGSQFFWSVRVNGIVICTFSCSNEGAANTPEQGGTTLFPLVAADAVTCIVFQDTGGALALKHFGTNELPALWIGRVG